MREVDHRNNALVTYIFDNFIVCFKGFVKMGKCKFNKYWVTDPKNEFKDIKDWILEVPTSSDKHKASCKFCKIEITCDGGIRDLRSHAKSVVHKSNAAVIQSNKTFLIVRIILLQL